MLRGDKSAVSPRQKAAFAYEICFSTQHARSTIRPARCYGEMRIHAVLAHPGHINNSLDGENQHGNCEEGPGQEGRGEEGPGQEGGGEEGPGEEGRREEGARQEGPGEEGG